MLSGFAMKGVKYYFLNMHTIYFNSIRYDKGSIDILFKSFSYFPSQENMKTNIRGGWGGGGSYPLRVK